MKKAIKYTVIWTLLFLSSYLTANAQAVKTNVPFTLTGNPNVGVEFTVGRKLTLNTEAMWMPYLFKKKEEVFRFLQADIELRYYPRPDYYYTNDMWDGFYIGPYVMVGNFNIGLKKKEELYDNNRYKGWGLSTGVSLGYKMYLSRRFRLDFNLGVGYAHLQYDKYPLGGRYNHKEYRKEIKNTRAWVGPTKFGIHLVYNIFR